MESQWLFIGGKSVEEDKKRRVSGESVESQRRRVSGGGSVEEGQWRRVSGVGSVESQLRVSRESVEENQWRRLGRAGWKIDTQAKMARGTQKIRKTVQQFTIHCVYKKQDEVTPLENALVFGWIIKNKTD